MKTSCSAGALVVAAVTCGAACGSEDAGREPSASTSSEIQGGTTDTTDAFAVGIFNQAISAICSGALLAPNLVATARHCVAQISSTQVDCATTYFGSLYSAGSIYVTTDTQISQNGTWHGVSQIIVPPGTSVCGNDIALLILSSNVGLAQYVTPSINPAMTDHNTYSVQDTAIGYGIDAPGNGSSAGTRRIKQNIDLACIPNDPTMDCFPQNAGVIDANEFASGDGTCEGDSGSSAYDQKAFSAGQWVSFGVLSRGGVNGNMCVGSIYTRFDTWGQMLINAGNQAASLGGYSPPAWVGKGLPPPSQDAGTKKDGGTKDAGHGADGGGGNLPDGQTCNADSDCAGGNCVAFDGTNYVCASACSSDSDCGAGFICSGGYCQQGTRGTDAGGGGNHGQPSGQSSGCAVGAGSPPGGWLAVALGSLGAAFARRRRGRGLV